MADKLISVPAPSIVLNSHDVPPPDYQMTVDSWKVPASTSPNDMVLRIMNNVAKQADKIINTLVFNSHGSPGRIHIGTGIGDLDLSNFQVLRKDQKSSHINQIWIIACKVAGKEENISGGASGELFCMNLAETTGSLVTAAQRVQFGSGPVSIPPGEVDSWVGEVYTYYPNRTKVQRQ